MNHDELVSKFSQTVGIEKAESIVADGLEATGLEPSTSYSTTELEELCAAIARQYDGYVALVAQEVRVHRQAQQWFEALLERISDPVVTVEFDDGVPVVSGTNPAFRETFGYGSDAVGTPLADLIVPPDRDVDPLDNWLVATDDAREVRRQTADGELRTFLFRPVTVTREGGRVEGYGIYVDITDRKRRERQLENQNEQLENFASVVSHDLRNPLNVAEGHRQLAAERTDDDVVRSHLEHVGTAHERMSELLETLLTLAREGQAVDDPELVPLTRVITQTWGTVDTPAATLRTEGLEDVLIAADETRFGELLENLFRNSVEHGSTRSRPEADDSVEHGSTSPPSQAQENTGRRGTSSEPSVADAPEDSVEHGSTSSRSKTDDSVEHGSNAETETELTVRVGLVPDDAEPIGFYLEDDGPGIPPANRDRIFDQGFTTREEGTGFGLAIVETIAEAHGWSVSLADPAPDRGARFEFTDVELRTRT